MIWIILRGMRETVNFYIARLRHGPLYDAFRRLTLTAFCFWKVTGRIAFLNLLAASFAAPNRILKLYCQDMRTWPIPGSDLPPIFCALHIGTDIGVL